MNYILVNDTMNLEYVSTKFKEINMNKELELLSKEIKLLKIKEKPNTFLKIIGKNDDEVIISSLVAFLLNPNNTTLKIIEKLLIKTKSEQDSADFVNLFYQDKNEFLSVNTEEWISRNSRVDIIIKFSEFWIVIENKIDANETGDQSLRYEKDLEKVNKPIKYICLKPDYNTVDLSNKHFVTIHYSEFAEILKQISIHEFEKQENYIYVNELIKHVEGYLMSKNEIEITEDVEFYIENRSRVNKIVENYSIQCKNVRNKLINKIKETFDIKDSFEDKYKIAVKLAYNCIQIWKTNWPNSIHYEIGYDLVNILGKDIEIIFRIDNESGKYKSIAKIESMYKDRYSFDNLENIEISINKIANKLKEIADENDLRIDEIVNQ